MGRASRRTGYGQNRGSLNPKITVSDEAPTNPKTYDIWIDISGASAVLKYWDGSSWAT